MIARNYALFSSAILMTMAVGCADSKGEGTSESAFAEVNSVQCSVARGAFVAKSTANADGSMTVKCPGTRNVAFNGEAIAGQSDAFSVKPHEGINILHVESGDEATPKVSDIPFMYGAYADANALTPNAIAVHVAAAGLSNGPLTLPLPAGPTAVNVSQIATQILRDQGNLLAKLDGTKKDVSKFGFSAGVQIIHSTYDAKNVAITVTAREGGVHLDATISNVASQVAWHAGVLGANLHDTIDASIGKIHLAADLDLSYDAGGRAIKANLGAHDLHVDGVELDSVALGRVPFGLADGLEEAISAGAEAIVNGLGDPILDAVKGSLLPKIAISLEQFHLPTTVGVPFLGGKVALKESFDGASFHANGLQISLGAGVLADPASKTNLAAPGWLTRPTGAATFDANKSFGASISLDYVNQALFSVWKQGLLNRQLSGPINALGISTGAIVSDAKMPPVLLPSPDGTGILLNIGELVLDTVFHSTSNGDAKVRLAVSLVVKAKVALQDGGASLLISPGGDEASTHLAAELIGVAPGNEAAAGELAGILTLFTPYLQTLISNDIELPPIAIPAIDLGLLTPGFAGRTGRFDGDLHVDGAASRIVLEGSVVAN